MSISWQVLSIFGPGSLAILSASLFHHHQISFVTAHSKKGIINATPTEETTSAVLRRMKHQKLLETLVGRSSSILLAIGFISRAYLVNGLITVVHNATLEVTVWGGIFKVIWASVPWPNMRNPRIAAPPYITTHKKKSCRAIQSILWHSRST